MLDLDETLIHSHHDGVLRPTVRPGTPPDFILKVCAVGSDGMVMSVLLRPFPASQCVVSIPWHQCQPEEGKQAGRVGVSPGSAVVLRTSPSPSLFLYRW